MGMALSGLASGFDWKSIVDQLIEVSRAPQNRMRRDQATNSQKSSALDEIRGKLASLKTSVAALNSPDSLLKKSATIADKNSNWAATATKDTPAGDYNVELMSQATTTIFKGRQDIGRAVETFSYIGNVKDGSWLGSTITPGTFTVNGVQISVNPATEKWEDLIDKIESLTLSAGKPVKVSWLDRKVSGVGAGAEAFVDDKFTITSGSTVDTSTGHGNSNGQTLTLGSATDTSNILQVLRLYANGTPSVTSSGETNAITATADYPHGLGMVQLDVPLRSGNLHPRFASSYQGGPGEITQGSGTFQVNGIDINYETDEDTIQSILDKITASSAGVSASYDRKYDQIVLQNKKPGNVAINIGVSGDNQSLANALGLIPGPAAASDTDMVLGQNAAFRINGGGILQAQSSTLTETDHGIKGLTINANSISSPTPTKITVAGDTSAAKDAVNEFVAKYNDVQNTIEKHTKVTVNGTKVTSSILSGNQELNILARSLRSSLFQSAGLTGTVNRLSDLGITSMGIQNTISLSNATALESKLSSAADDLANFFKTPTTGFVARFDKLLSSVVTESGSAAGSFKARQDSISKQNSSIDKQIEDMERRLASQRAMLESSFIAMERAQSGFQQQSAYLAKTFNGK
jgi:flagellar hook-associated protein 2